MNKTAQVKLASILATLALLVFAGVLYLAFIFPKIAAIWAGTGEALSAAQRTVVSLSEFCRHYGLLLLPLLMVGIGGCVVWVAVSVREGTRKAASDRPTQHS
ncbi:MAG TPA: hypothetical protein VJA21_18485 [Verrucomicrobiae bacterium]